MWVFKFTAGETKFPRDWECHMEFLGVPEHPEIPRGTKLCGIKTQTTVPWPPSLQQPHYPVRATQFLLAIMSIYFHSLSLSKDDNVTVSDQRLKMNKHASRLASRVIKNATTSEIQPAARSFSVPSTDNYLSRSTPQDHTPPCNCLSFVRPTDWWSVHFI